MPPAAIFLMTSYFPNRGCPSSGTGFTTWSTPGMPWEFNFEQGSGRIVRPDADAAAVIVRNGADDGKPKSCTALLPREVGFEKVLPVFFPDARPVVGNRYPYPVEVGIPRASDRHVPFPPQAGRPTWGGGGLASRLHDANHEQPQLSSFAAASLRASSASFSAFCFASSVRFWSW